MALPYSIPNATKDPRKKPVAKTPSPNTQGLTKEFFGPPASAPQVGPDPRFEPLQPPPGAGTVGAPPMPLTATPPVSGIAAPSDPRTVPGGPAPQVTHRPPDEQARLAKLARDHQKALLEGQTRTPERIQQIANMQGSGGRGGGAVDSAAEAEQAGQAASIRERMAFVGNLQRGVTTPRIPSGRPTGDTPADDLIQAQQLKIQDEARQLGLVPGGRPAGGVAGVLPGAGFVPSAAQLAHARKTGRVIGQVHPDRSLGQSGFSRLPIFDRTARSPHREVIRDQAELKRIEQQMSAHPKQVQGPEQQELADRKAQLEKQIEIKQAARQMDLDARKNKIREERDEARGKGITVQKMRNQKAIAKDKAELLDQDAQRITNQIVEADKRINKGKGKGKGKGGDAVDVVGVIGKMMDTAKRQIDVRVAEGTALEAQLKALDEAIAIRKIDINAKIDPDDTAGLQGRSMIAKRNRMAHKLEGINKRIGDLRNRFGKLGDRLDRHQTSILEEGATDAIPGISPQLPDGTPTVDPESQQPGEPGGPEVISGKPHTWPQPGEKAIRTVLENPDTLPHFEEFYGPEAAELIRIQLGSDNKTQGAANGEPVPPATTPRDAQGQDDPWKRQQKWEQFNPDFSKFDKRDELRRQRAK